MPLRRCWALSQAANAAGIATVVDVVNEGYRTPPGADETAAKSADELVQNEALRTEKESTIAVKFVDGSELSVEQSSEMVLSDYVFDGSAASGLINLNNGLFHFTSNGKPDQGVKLKHAGRDDRHPRHRVPGACRRGRGDDHRHPVGCGRRDPAWHRQGDHLLSKARAS